MVMKAIDVMTRDPFTITDTDTLGVAQSAMARRGIRHLPVVHEGRLVGMLSERDVLRARSLANGGDYWWATTVKDAMQATPQTAGPDDSLTEIAGRMAAAKIGALPIVEGGKLLAIVTVPDVLAGEVRSAMGQAAKGPVATAADVMTPWPITTRPDVPLGDAVAVMADRHVRHLPVVDAGSAIVGMLSESDVRTAVGSPLDYIRRHSGFEIAYRVQDVMTRSVVIVPLDRPLAEVARQFADERLTAVPVVDNFAALVGIISYVDVLRALAR
jgi:acetoin utilization protein AcuB